MQVIGGAESVRNVLAQLRVDGQHLGVAHEGEGQDRDGVGRLKRNPNRLPQIRQRRPRLLTSHLFFHCLLLRKDRSQRANCFPVINSGLAVGQHWPRLRMPSDEAAEQQETLLLLGYSSYIVHL